MDQGLTLHRNFSFIICRTFFKEKQCHILKHLGKTLTHQSVFHETAHYTLFYNKRSEEIVTKLYTGLYMKLAEVTIPFSTVWLLFLPRQHIAAKTLTKKTPQLLYSLLINVWSSYIWFHSKNAKRLNSSLSLTVGLNWVSVIKHFHKYRTQ
jgi:hypothetical protein